MPVATKETSCVDPAGGPILEEQEKSDSTMKIPKEVAYMTARVGKPAPDFEAGALINNAFKNIKLSDYLGKWVVLCFYPGDFTFV